MEKRLAEINARKVEIRAMLDKPEADLNALETEVQALDTEAQGIEQRLKIAGKLNTGEARGTVIPLVKAEQRSESEDKYATVEYRKAFMNSVVRGTPIPVEYRLDANSVTSEIGTVIPTTIIEKIVEKMEAVGMILPLVTRTGFKGGVAIPTSAAKPVATWTTQGSGSDKQKKQTSSITFAYWKLRCAVSVSFETDVVALAVFEQTIIKNITEAMTKALEQAIISGGGSDCPKGILIETPATGQNIVGTPTYAKLLEMEGALPVEYEGNAKWCMTKKTFTEFLKETDDGGQPIARVNYGLAGRPERVLLGRPVVLCNYLDSYVSNLTSAAIWAFLFDFGDYVLNTNYNMTLKKYEDNDTDDQITKAILLADGKVIDKNSLVTIEMA